ncbi:MAG TPA: hypothetical protein ENK15_02640 [Thermopetrobacter sp.]|nr:hypothetical protein [Thermopetrobacter sp.]
MSEEMTIGALRDLLERHGADEDRWPERHRAAMKRRCAADRRAAQALAEARALDALLAEPGPPPPNPALAGAILRAARGAPDAANDNPPARWWAAGALAASLLLGLWLGLSGIADGGGLLSGAAQVAGADPLADIVELVTEPEGGA